MSTCMGLFSVGYGNITKLVQSVPMSANFESVGRKTSVTIQANAACAVIAFTCAYHFCSKRCLFFWAAAFEYYFWFWEPKLRTIWLEFWPKIPYFISVVCCMYQHLLISVFCVYDQMKRNLMNLWTRVRDKSWHTVHSNHCAGVFLDRHCNKFSANWKWKMCWKLGELREEICSNESGSYMVWTQTKQSCLPFSWWSESVVWWNRYSSVSVENMRTENHHVPVVVPHPLLRASGKQMYFVLSSAQ